MRGWAEAAHAERGVRAMRLIQGALQLTRRHPKEQVLRAARLALQHHQFRLMALSRLIEQAPRAVERTLLQNHPSIRPMTQYSLRELE